jgi:hypothetical protein
MKKYVQTPKNLYFTFCKCVGHDDRDCRDYDLMHERSRDIYKIQGEVQQEGNTTQYNSPRKRKLQSSQWIQRKRMRRMYGPRSRTDHLLQLHATRTLGKGLSEPLHNLQLLHLIRPCYRRLSMCC